MQQKRCRSSRRRPPISRRRDAPPRRDPESYALIREGLTAHFDQDETTAREFFEEALARQKSNWSAYVNLALTEARLAQDFDGAILILDDALLEMTGGAWAR